MRRNHKQFHPDKNENDGRQQHRAQHGVFVLAPWLPASGRDESTLTCPSCGNAKTETMSLDACQFYYECEACGQLLRPKPGDCCVFCSYGSVPCPQFNNSA